MNWFVLAVLASIFLSLSSIAQKNIFNNIKISPFTVIAWLQLMTGLLLISFLPFQSLVYPTDLTHWSLVVLTIVFWTVGNCLYIKGVEKIDISEVLLLFSLVPVGTFFGGVIFLGETVDILKIVGIVLAVSGLTMVYFQGQLRWSVYHTLTILAAMVISFGMTADRFLIDSFSPLLYGAISWTLPGLLILSLPVVRTETKALSKKIWLLLSVPAILTTAFTLSVYGAYRANGEISRIGAVLRLTAIYTVILGYFLFNERREIIRKLIGGAIIVTGVILLR